MATIAKSLAVKLKLNREAAEQTKELVEGDSVDIVQTWQRHVLIRDSDGHYFTVLKETVNP